VIGVGSVEIKTEADSNDISESSHDDSPTTGMLLHLFFFTVA